MVVSGLEISSLASVGYYNKGKMHYILNLKLKYERNENKMWIRNWIISRKLINWA